MHVRTFDIINDFCYSTVRRAVTIYRILHRKRTRQTGEPVFPRKSVGPEYRTLNPE